MKLKAKEVDEFEALEVLPSHNQYQRVFIDINSLFLLLLDKI